MPRALGFRRCTTRLPARLLVVLAMLFAQLGAQVHAYSHLGATPFRAAPVGAPQMCAECLAFTPLYSAAHGAVKPEYFCHNAPDAYVAEPAGSLVKTLPLHAFRSRAPPSLV
jgi:hypothetical protein